MKWDDVAGLDAAKEALKEAVILPVKFKVVLYLLLCPVCLLSFSFCFIQICCFGLLCHNQYFLPRPSAILYGKKAALEGYPPVWPTGDW